MHVRQAVFTFGLLCRVFLIGSFVLPCNISAAPAGVDVDVVLAGLLSVVSTMLTEPTYVSTDAPAWASISRDWFTSASVEAWAFDGRKERRRIYLTYLTLQMDAQCK